MKDRLKVKIDGLNLNKLINEFLKNDIIIEELQIKQRRIAFFVNNQYKTKIELICKKYHKNYKIIQNNFIFNIAKYIHRYFGVFMSFVLCFCYMFSFNIFVSKINLSYKFEMHYDIDKVEEFLIKNNIYSGMLKSDVSSQKIESLIISNFSDISACSVKLSGGVLDIIVYPSIAANKLNKQDLISKYNAVVSSVDVYAGVAKVDVGDVVKVGDVLIENYNGASGEIYGKVIFEDYLIYNENQTIQEKTGNYFEDYSISLFGFDLIKTQNCNDFDLKTTQICKMLISRNLFIPICYNKMFAYENKIVDVIVPFENKEIELKEELKNKILSKIENREDVRSISFSVVSENGYTRLDCFIECELKLI